MRLIEIGDAISGAPAGERVLHMQVDGDEPTTDLRMLLRRASRFRKGVGAEARKRLIETWQEIWALEAYSLKQQVISVGYAQTGNAWVNASDIDDVVADLMLDATKLFLAFEGVEVGQFRAAMNKRVHWTVVNYVRKDTANASKPVDPSAFDPSGFDDADSRHAELAGAASSCSAETRAQYNDTLEAITKLEPRAAEVVSLRAAGYSSAEVAVKLDLSPANVDQIFSRSVRTMRKLLTDD